MYVITLLITPSDDAAETSFSCGFQAVLRVRVSCPPPIEKRPVWQDRSFSFLRMTGGTRTREGMGVGGRPGEPSGSIIYSANSGTSFCLFTSTRPRVVIFSDGITGRLRNAMFIKGSIASEAPNL